MLPGLFVVYLCGPTDCFPKAAFISEKLAIEFGKAKRGPEGFLVRQVPFDHLEEEFNLD